MTWSRRLWVVGLIGAVAAAYLLSGGDGGWLRTQFVGSPEPTTPAIEERESDVLPAAQSQPEATADTDAEPDAAGPRTATSETSASQSAAEDGSPERMAPAFDVVRVEDAGEVVIAGVAPPGSTVHIETGDGVIGKVEAGFDGTWVLLPKTRLPAGDHSLSLTAEVSDGSLIAGSERVAVSIGEGGPAVVALSEDNEPTRILQSGRTGSSDPAEKSAQGDAGSVSFAAVDYEDEEQTGRLFMSGEAQPGARIALYVDNRFIGSTKAEEDGGWQFDLTDILDADTHLLRADHVNMDSGEVLSRAEVRFSPEDMAVAALEGGETRTAVGSSGQAPREGSDQKEPASAQRAADSAGASEAEEDQQRKKAIVVRSGDTLWHIAEEYYGSGVRYTTIFRNNREQIRNPHRIYPGQNFELPQ